MEAILDAAPSRFVEPVVIANGRAQFEQVLDAVVPATSAPSDGDDVSSTDCWSGSISEVSVMAARLLAADTCMIMLIAGNIGESAARCAISAGRPLLIDGRSCDVRLVGTSKAASCVERIVVSPIRIGREIVGAINFFKVDRTRCDAALLAATEIVASLVGQSLQALRLESLLHSRFAQLAIFVASDNKAEQALTVARGGVGQLARILAKSFYREMVRLGCDSGQIVDAASEIISQLSGSLKKHRDRLQRIPKTTGDGE
jgi:hypothetical protein